jgi:YD repeat-containing protein
MTDPEGNQYSYSYDDEGNLSSVTYPDGTPLDSLDNPTRSYHYENTSFPSHLTGLTDETGSRVTWDFDSEGRAISSELDGGVDKSTLDFSVADQVTVTNPLGKNTTYHFEALHGVKKVVQVEGHATESCAGANQNYTYDANGYIEIKTDWQGNVTTYVHNARGLESSRTEASGAAQARIITTEWHDDLRLPIKIISPGQITDFVYDTQGRLTSQTTHDVQ